MAIVWQLLLLLGVWAPPCDLTTVLYGSAEECKRAHMVPGYNLGGEGFDIVTMKRKGAYVIDSETWDTGNGSCKLYPNRYMGRELQKVPVAVVDWRVLPKCTLAVSSTAYDSAESLVKDSTSSVTNNWKLSLNIPVHTSVSLGFGFGGSHSRATKFAMEKSQKDRYNFYQHSIHCTYYQFRVTAKPPIDKEFLSAVTSLDPYSTKSEASYRSIIDTYGTHYITQVILGGEIQAITSVKTCEASINGLTETEVSDCLSVEASANFDSKASIKAMTEHCRAKRNKLGHNFSFSSSFNERFTETIGGEITQGDVLFDHSNPSVYNEWLKTLKTSPDVVKYNLKPLHTLLPSGHFAVNGIKKEVENYIIKNALVQKCSGTCKVGHRSNPRDPCACVCNSSQNLRSNCCPTGKGRATLKVYNLYAEKLYGDRWTKTDGSVEVVYGEQEVRTDIISNDDNPRWKNWFDFGPITINMKDRLQLKVYDEDTYWNSDLLGNCSVSLHQGKVSDSCMLNHGTLYYSYTVECAPSLGGDQCQEYIPSPQSFYSRNGTIVEDWKGLSQV